MERFKCLSDWCYNSKEKNYSPFILIAGIMLTFGILFYSIPK